MTVFVCVDVNGGIAFNNRRVSRDSAVCADILKMTGGRLTLDSYSRPLFEAVIPDPEYVFIERDGVSKYDPTTLVIYNWNRVYPSDVTLDIEPETSGYTLESETEFSGTSHEKITKQVWRKG